MRLFEDFPLISSCSTYVLIDPVSGGRVKVCAGTDPEREAGDYAFKFHGPGKRRMIRVHEKWSFQSEYAALYVQQALLKLLNHFEYPRHPGDWYDVDKEGLRFVRDALRPLIATLQHEEQNRLASQADNPAKPYGQYLMRQALLRISDRRSKQGSVEK